MFATIDQKVSTPLTDALPALPEPGLSIVTLGYALHGDGSTDDILIDRLRQTKAAAQSWPTAPVVVTGGVEQSAPLLRAVAGHPFSGHPQTGGSTDEGPAASSRATTGRPRSARRQVCLASFMR
jgi:hypothetical protein